MYGRTYSAFASRLPLCHLNSNSSASYVYWSSVSFLRITLCAALRVCHLTSNSSTSYVYSSFLSYTFLRKT
jgi:hypothetical protein